MQPTKFSSTKSATRYLINFSLGNGIKYLCCSDTGNIRVCVVLVLQIFSLVFIWYWTSPCAIPVLQQYSPMFSSSTRQNSLHWSGTEMDILYWFGTKRQCCGDPILNLYSDIDEEDFGNIVLDLILHMVTPIFPCYFRITKPSYHYFLKFFMIPLVSKLMLMYKTLFIR